MAVKRAKVDKIFLISSVLLIVFGYIIFNSASLALLAKENSNYSNILMSQTILGLLFGSIALMFASRSNIKFWKKGAFYFLLIAVILNILVLVPSIGVEHGGAKRWISFLGFSFQPSEILKFAFIIYFAAWASSVKEKIKTVKWGLLPLMILLGGAALLLLNQPDTDNFLMIVFAGLAMFLVAGGKWRHILLIVIIGIIGVAILAYTTPYLKERINTFFNPKQDAQGASYQVQQSLIAIGSGGFSGRGFGQSVQKYTYLPEPAGDSIFAVVGEEFGFVGSVTLLLFFVFFAIRGLKIASDTSDIFARLVAVGIVIMIIFQAFINIGAMLGVVPLSGITLPFVSHGGTSLFFTLLEVGLLLSISRTRSS